MRRKRSNGIRRTVTATATATATAMSLPLPEMLITIYILAEMLKISKSCQIYDKSVHSSGADSNQRC